MVLQVLKPELEDPAVGEDLPNESSPPSTSHERITVVSRRVLPSLRQYSVWLVTRAQLLVDLDTGATRLHIHEMWKVYADILAQLANIFPPSDITPIQYLLEEDENTIGFNPLRSPQLPLASNLYSLDSGKLKSRTTDLGTARHHPNVEMRGRIRDIIICGLVLQDNVKYPQVPVALHDGSFVFVQGGISIANGPTPPTVPQSTNSPRNTASPCIDTRIAEPINNTSAATKRVPTPEPSFDVLMSRMVEDLVNPSNGSQSTNEETSYGIYSNTANDIFPTSTPHGSHSRVHSTTKMLPSLPSLYNSAFAPMPNELQPTSPNRLYGARQPSPISFGTPEQQVAAAEHLDQITGGSSRSPWGATVSQNVSPTRYQHCGRSPLPLSGTEWNDDSSNIYGNTPLPRYPGGSFIVGNGNGHNSTFDPTADSFAMNAMLQSSLPSGNQNGGYSQTPPGGQGG